MLLRVISWLKVRSLTQPAILILRLRLRAVGLGDDERAFGQLSAIEDARGLHLALFDTSINEPRHAAFELTKDHRISAEPANSSDDKEKYGRGERLSRILLRLQRTSGRDDYVAED